MDAEDEEEEQHPERIQDESRTEKTAKYPLEKEDEDVEEEDLEEEEEVLGSE